VLHRLQLRPAIQRSSQQPAVHVVRPALVLQGPLKALDPLPQLPLDGRRRVSRGVLPLFLWAAVFS
jgi:hypothetical protein